MAFTKVTAYKGQLCGITKSSKFQFVEFLLIIPSPFIFKSSNRISDKKEQIHNLFLRNLNITTRLNVPSIRDVPLFKEKSQFLDSRKINFFKDKGLLNFFEITLTINENHIRINYENSGKKISNNLLDPNILNSNKFEVTDFNTILFNMEYGIESLSQRLNRTNVEIYDEYFFAKKCKKNSMLKRLQLESINNFLEDFLYNFIEFKLKLHLLLHTTSYRFFSRFMPIQVKISIMRILPRSGDLQICSLN